MIKCDIGVMVWLNVIGQTCIAVFDIRVLVIVNNIVVVVIVIISVAIDDIIDIIGGIV